MSRRQTISSFFQADHARLGELLDRSVASPDRFDDEAFAEMRAGLLRHIALEEKILLPALRREHGDAITELARRLRVDHGAIALLLVPTPSPELVAELRSILVPHDRLEEAFGGLYALGDELAADVLADVLARSRSYPPVKVARYQDGPRVCRTAAEALAVSERQTAMRPASPTKG